MKNIVGKKLLLKKLGIQSKKIKYIGILSSIDKKFNKIIKDLIEKYIFIISSGDVEINAIKFL